MVSLRANVKSLDFYGTTALGKEKFQVPKPFFTPAATFRLHYKLRLGANVSKLYSVSSSNLS